jgi:exodeoxyribonuclease V alpha subunit
VKGQSTLAGDAVASLAPFVEVGLLDASALHLAALIARTVGGVDPEVLLGAALAARAPRLGHVCVVIRDIARSVVLDDAGGEPAQPLPWPEPERWARQLAASPAVRDTNDPRGEVVLPLVWDGTRLYLERYWRFEEGVATDLLSRAEGDRGLAGARGGLVEILDGLFGSDGARGVDRPEPRQREAAVKALGQRITVIAGGPGTGKTLTVSRLLGAAYTASLGAGHRLDVALAAPTGKAAARMAAAVQDAAATLELRPEVADALRATEAKTLHRLLGIAMSGTVRFDRANRLPHDLVVVDETSMVSLPLIARLLDAVREDASVVLVGDPFQLASVEAGAVLGEIVGPAAFGPAAGPLADHVVMLEHNYRFGPDSQITALADAIRAGEADDALDILRGQRSGELTWLEVTDGDDAGRARLIEEAADNAVEVVRAAMDGDAVRGLGLASELKVLCATRFGLLGVSGWTAAIASLLQQKLPHAGIGGQRYVGRPVIVTRNDYLNRVFNGDVGLVVASPAGPAAAFLDPSGEIRLLAISQLGDLDTWWATTIHKSQGSEFERVIVSLPPAPSPILTRELLYTAVTRAKSQVTLVAEEESLRAAIGHPVARASGLRSRLWPEPQNAGSAKPATLGRGPKEPEQLRFEV